MSPLERLSGPACGWPSGLLTAACLALSVTASVAQDQGSAALTASDRARAAATARVWGTIARPTADGEAAARDALRRAPRDLGVVAAAIEVVIARKGAGEALALYEDWLGTRPSDDALVLRRVARAFLVEATAAPELRLEAVRALSQGGDPTAQELLQGDAEDPRSATTRTAAAMGDETAARVLVESLDRPDVDPVRTMEALAAGEHTAAVPALLAKLGHRRRDVRAAAADALGKVGTGAEASERLAALLQDESGYVQTRAAAALFRLGDDRGLPILMEMARSEVPAGRLAAAESLAVRPTAEWARLVTELTTGTYDPDVRIGAARLLAARDPALVQSVVKDLAQHDNPAIREMVTALAVEATGDQDLAALRRLLHAADPPTRLRAAARVFLLTM